MPTPPLRVIATLLLAAPAVAAHAADGAHPYAGLETRQIKALPEADVAALREGAGMGYALAAELNGYPGPAHVLEHAAALELTDDQLARTRALYRRMRTEAIGLGERLIAAETALDRAFGEGTIDRARLAALVDRVAEIDGELRATHLAAHLEMLDILTATQAQRYRVLRGYAEADPAAAGPAEPARSNSGGRDGGAHRHGGHGHEGG